MKAEQYSYLVEWSEEDKCHVARVMEFSFLSSHGDTAGEALASIQEVVEFVLDELKADGKEIPIPFSLQKYSGRLNLRMPPEVHKKIALEALRQRVSINQLINSRL
jgi:predicted HicB family RNase H-like nuclease